jgi:hypothetical protein
MPDASNLRRQDVINEPARSIAKAVPVAEAGEPVMAFADVLLTLVGGCEGGPTCADAQVIRQHVDNVHVHAGPKSLAAVSLAYTGSRVKASDDVQPQAGQKARFLCTRWEGA